MRRREQQEVSQTVPNWCENELTIVGARERLLAFYRQGKGPSPSQGEGESALSADRFVPMPEEYTTAEGYDRYGYDWAIRNWGTKWGLQDVQIDPVDEELLTNTEFSSEASSYLFYTFRTAWSPPDALIRAMAAQFPTLRFSLAYFETGMGFQGILVVEGVEVKADVTTDYGGDRGG